MDRGTSSSTVRRPPQRESIIYPHSHTRLATHLRTQRCVQVVEHAQTSRRVAASLSMPPYQNNAFFSRFGGEHDSFVIGAVVWVMIV